MPQANSTETAPAAPRRPGRPKSIPGQPKATLTVRRSRSSVPNSVTLAKTLVDSMMSSGSASQKGMEIVLDWVRSIGNEADALKELVKRPRRARTAGASERIAKLELNKTLLQGILSGDLAVSVDVDGDIIFAKK
jgi:hypothetical protein